MEKTRNLPDCNLIDADHPIIKLAILSELEQKGTTVDGFYCANGTNSAGRHFFACAPLPELVDKFKALYDKDKHRYGFYCTGNPLHGGMCYRDEAKNIDGQICNIKKN